MKVFASQDGTEKVPRSTQDSPKTVLKSYFFDVQNYDRFWCDLGSIWGAFWEAFWLPKGHQKLIKFISSSKSDPKRLKEGPKRPQESPERSPRGPRRTPREPQKAPKRLQEHPKRIQKVSEMRE